MRVIEQAKDLLGDWSGVNEFRLMPEDAAEPLASSARVGTAAGNGLTLAYTWTHPADGLQEGFLLVFDREHAGEAAGVWLDSWHQAPEPMTLTGTHDRAGIRLTAEYGEGWNWIVMLAKDPDGQLRLSMENQGPDVEAYPAMAAVQARVV